MSTVARWIGRLVKLVIGLLLVPPFLGVAAGVWRQLGEGAAGSKSFADWALLGIVGYVGVHLFVVQPKALFRAQHRLLSTLSVWLFGGQVTTEPPKGEKKSEKTEKGKGSAEGAQGSTLLVLSPYLIPLYTMLACVASWVLKRSLHSELLDPITAVLIGASLSLHWVMAADDLQQNRKRFPVDAYLLALVLIGLVSSVVVALCLPMAVPSFSVPGVFAEAMRQAHAIYAAVFGALFV
ncbi:MAG: hypothetical protein HY596_02145 [Candidatus Omnitrophica bacterium]|nr:hypothetical protein [Candidatus Omnitrophota bacterium]